MFTVTMFWLGEAVVGKSALRFSAATNVNDDLRV
jgi:hypothetical protein